MEDNTLHGAVTGDTLQSTVDLSAMPPELLARIEEHLDRDSLTSYTTCCKYLRASGVRSMLYAHPVVLKTALSVRSFCDFMHADLSRRKPALRSLTIDTPHPTPQDVLTLRGRLAHALIHAPNLSYLSLGRCLKDILERSPALYSAIHSLSSLTTLNMESDTGLWPQAIMQIHSASLTNLDVGYLTTNMPDALDHHASTLQSLSVGARSVEAALGCITYVNVRALSWIGELTEGAWDLSAMMDLFPNLEKLSAWMRFSDLDPLHSLATMANSLAAMTFPFNTIRAANLEKQSRCPWPRLRYLSGDLSALYMLAPDCQVDVLSVTDNIRLEIWNYGDQIRETFRNLRHPIRTLHLKYRSAWESGVAESLKILLMEALQERSPHLVIDFLVIELLILNDLPPEQIFGIMMYWPTVIGKLAPRKVLLHVRIVPSMQDKSTSPTVAERYVQRGLDLEDLGTTIAASTRAVKRIYVKISWRGGQKTKGWARALNYRAEIPLAELKGARRTVEKVLRSLA
ncbi:hypothetical protein PENSPDRAFT_752536 [Peniophora sp. CONT]|nr:hypothetical protein PENSPDRAFT_752536 [Peniophora sp. CONT]